MMPTDVRRLADRLEGTAGNPYKACDKLFGFRPDDDLLLFDRLRAEQGLFWCVECGIWKAHADRSAVRPDECEECTRVIGKDPPYGREKKGNT